MAYVVTETCIKCKHMDCVDACPVSCFYEGANMLVIHPDQCIDCSACVPACPVDAIVPDTDPAGRQWLDLNRQYAAAWPNILDKGTPPADANEWGRVLNKFAQFFDPRPGGR